MVLLRFALHKWLPFLVNLDTLLHLIGSTKVRVSWLSALMKYMVAAYKQLESLFLPLVYFVLQLTWDFLLPKERHQLTVSTPMFVS
jgi:hypothetical protein